MRLNISFWIVALTLGAVGACQDGEVPSLSSSTSDVAGTNRLSAGEILLLNQSIFSGSTTLTYQSNGLVLAQGGAVLWSAGNVGTPIRFEMQTDCNAVVWATILVSTPGGQLQITAPVWSTMTSGRGTGCYAKVIEGDWFVCSGTTRVFSARGGGDCSNSTPFMCSELSGSVPLPGIENYHVRIDPDSLYVCDTSLGWEGHIPWPQLSQAEINSECVGACGAGCSPSTCTKHGIGNYVNVGNGMACRDVQYDCYSADCCWYHDLCGRMYPTSLFTNPFCSALGTVYGCAACIGNGFPGCALIPPTYTRSFVHSYTSHEDCIQTCVDRPGDCYDDCSGTCWFGCDFNLDCYDDCTGIYYCSFPCPDYGLGTCWPYGSGLASERSADPGRGLGVAVSNESRPATPLDLEVHVGQQIIIWRSDELTAASSPLAKVATLTPEEHDRFGSRQGWSLRELVRRKFGDNARVMAVSGEDGTRVELDARAWRSADSTPILRVNKRGQFRFGWLGTRNRLPGLGGVHTIEVNIEPDRAGSQEP
jgi:hypothetical protein